MRKVKGTGDKVNMNANSMLIGKEMDGNKITALYTLNKNGVRRRITKSEFINSAKNNKIINCKFNGRTLVGIEDSLRNIPAYDKKTGMLKNNVTEEQVIIAVNQRLIQNRLVITAKLKYNNQIIGYIVANEQGQEKRFNRENTYKLIKQGFLPDYKAKIENGIPYIYGGNISSIPEIKVDSQGRNIEDKERMKKILEEQKKLREQHEKELKKQKELEKEQHKKEVASAEKIAKELKKQLKEEEKAEKKEIDEQQKQLEERNKKLGKIDRILDELGNSSEILRRQIVDVYVEKGNIEITKECIEKTCEKMIKTSDKYNYALEVLKIISKTNGALKQEDSDKIAVELKKVSTNLLATTDNEEIIEIVSNKVGNKVSNVNLHLVVKQIHGIWEDGTIIDLITVGAIVKRNEKNIYIKYSELPEDLKIEANKITKDRVVISNKVTYTNNQIENYIKIITERAGNEYESLNKEVIRKVKEFITDRKSDYVALDSLNGFIYKLMDEVNRVVGDELDTVKQILSLTLINPLEIKLAADNMIEFNRDLCWRDRYSISLDLKIKLSTEQYSRVNLIEGIKVTQLTACTILNINGKLCILPKYLDIHELVAGIIVNYQINEQKACSVFARYDKNCAIHNEQWVSYGNMTSQLRKCILSCRNIDEILIVLKNANINIGIINDIKEIKKLLKSSMIDISLKNVAKEEMIPTTLYTSLINNKLNIIGVEVRIKDKKILLEYEQFTQDILEWAEYTLSQDIKTDYYGKNIYVSYSSIAEMIESYLLNYGRFDAVIGIIENDNLISSVKNFIKQNKKQRYGKDYIELYKLSQYCGELSNKNIK